MATRLYGILWRWHFLAGIAAFPLLLVISITGALYTFQPELDRWANSALLTVEPPEPPAARRPVDELLAVAEKVCQPSGFSLTGEHDRPFIAYCLTGARREVYVDPYRGTLLGDREVSWSFFGVVFALHWELALGDWGRLAIEWATSWALLLMISGAALWWPRGKRRGGGVWWPRRELRSRQWLRDLHAVIGAYALPVLLVITATGLMWTLKAGEERWHPLTDDLMHQTYHEPPTSTAIAGAPRVGFAAAIAGAGIDPDGGLGIYAAMSPRPEDPVPRPADSYNFYVYDDTFESPSLGGAYWVDAYSGKLLLHLDWHDRSLAGKLDTAKYSIHVGALLGWPGRIAACIAALILAALCITGPWMWWKRRPRGGIGVPPRGARRPWPLFVLLAVLGVLMPLVGWSLLAIVAIELGRWLWRLRGGGAEPTAGPG